MGPTFTLRGVNVPPAPPPPPQPAAAGSSKAGPAISLVGGALVSVGSLMPWASIATVFGTVNLNGTEGDGKITLVLGLLVVLFAILELTGSSGTRGIGLVVALLAAAAGIYDMTNLSSRMGEVTSEFARPSVGVGLYAVVGGGALAVIGSVVKR